ncbi:hypothetical protein C8R43DRAFT_1069164 [Mycena crocata]|nr:hypothetical protein C8R43DRAFT_1069164 [Mycena crocata]
MICALSRILRENFDIQWTPENSQIRCLAHVVNLVVQKILAALEEAEDPDVEDYYIPHKDLPFHYDPNADPDLAGLEQEKFEKEHEGTEEEDADAVFMAALAPELKKLSPLAKLRATTVKICSSPQRRKRFKSGSTELYQGQRAESGKLLCSLMVVRDVKHRWNYTEELRSLLLQPEDWQLLEKLGAMLQIFTHVTLQMSKSHTPTLPWVLPMYEHMVKALGVNRDDETLLPSLRTAATAGLEKLNVYYEKAKQCQFNVIATLLHPRLGMRWFKNLDKDRAANAKTLFEFAFDAYEKTHAEKLKRAPKSPRKVAKSGNSFLDDVCMLDGDDDDLIPMQPEFERFYMAYQTHGRGDINKPLAWWKVGSHNNDSFLRLT